MRDPLFLVIDLFCGAGGTTTGFVQAEFEGYGLAKVIACVNHDPVAIQSHWRNHPEVKHFEEDIRTLKLETLVDLLNTYRREYPNALVVLWASLECTNFSKAKGGLPRDADSRTLAEHLDRYIIALNPDYIKIENVVEFMSWGPLDQKGKPISRKNGEDFMRWRKEICAFGYTDQWKELNSANFGAYTSRNRLFGSFARPWLPVVWPEPTHSKKPSKFSMHGDLNKWNAVREVLDFSDKGESIVVRKKPIVDASLERYYAGLVKFAANGDTSFLVKHFSGNPKDKVTSSDEPAGTLTTKPQQSLVQPEFLACYYGNGDNVTSVASPAPTVTTKDRMALVQPEFLLNPQWGGNALSVEDPCPVIIARQDKSPLYLVQLEAGTCAIPIYEDDSDVMRRIKSLMAAYNIVDIKMRMLRVHELLKIQGFPHDYKLEGNQADQKKFIGNSVVPLVVKKWTEALAMRIIENKTQVA